MKIEIQLSSPHPTCSTLEVYSNSVRPICIIDEGDFYEILSPNQAKRFEDGEYKFDVKKIDLFDKCKRWLI